MIPYGLSVAGLSFPGKSVRVKLEGPGSGSWHYGLAPHEAPGVEPDAVIEGGGYAFAMVAGRRVPAQEYLSSGGLIVGGDIELAETVLSNLRVFAV